MRAAFVFFLLLRAARPFAPPLRPPPRRSCASTTALEYLSESDANAATTAAVPPPPNGALPKRRRPVRRSFFHQLDRFLTELQGTHDHLRKHAFLSGNFAPVSKEHVAAPVEVVEGSIPENLVGAFLRNGPNPIQEIQRKRYHWFDGHAMLHTLMFENGRARYTNQFIPCPRFSIEKELGEEFFPTVGEYKGMLGLMKLSIHPQLVREKIEDLKTVAPPNTNILMYNNKLYCLHEANLPMEVRMRRDGTLGYIGHETFDGILDYPVSAHPVKDGNDLLFHSYSVDQQLIEEHGTMKVGRYNSASRSVDTYLVPTPTKSHVSFAHSLVHTDSYIVVWDCSVHFSTDALFKGGSFFKNNRRHTLKFGLIPKDATSREDVVWVDSEEAGAIVHPLHAWEEVVQEYECGELKSTRTVIKLWTPFCSDLSLDLSQANEFHMIEYTIDPRAKTVSREVIDSTINSEFSVMPPKAATSSSAGTRISSGYTTKIDARSGTTTRYISTLSAHDRYGFTAIFGDKGHFTGWAKWDLFNRRLESSVYYGKHEVGGEPMVVRAKKRGKDADDSIEEEDIYVGCYVFNEEEDQSYFILYDGSTNEKLCRLKMPSRVPFGFHGQFISGEEIEAHAQYHDALDAGFHAQCPMEWIRFFIRDFILDHSPTV